MIECMNLNIKGTLLIRQYSTSEEQISKQENKQKN